MYRKLENANISKIMQLLNKINSGIKSMLIDYPNLYSDKEIELLKHVSSIINKQLNEIANNNINYELLSDILEYEMVLKPLIFRCWEEENNKGNEYISWYKYDKLRNLQQVVSTTFGQDVSFCESRYGVSFEVSLEGFLGACNKDAATLIEESNKQSLYTIGKTAEGKVINSYNLATPIITPHQVFDKSDNTYMSKYNEIILDRRYIKPKAVVYTTDDDLEIVNLISQQFNIPIKKIKGYAK